MMLMINTGSTVILFPLQTQCQCTHRYIVTALPSPSQCHISYQYQAYRKSWGINAMSSVIVEVETDDGTTGVGKHMILCTFSVQAKT